MISLKHFTLLTSVIRWIFILTMWFFFFNFIYHSYQFYQINKITFLQIADLHFVEKNYQLLFQLGITFLISFGWMVAKIIFTAIIYFIYHRLPIPSSLLHYWFQQHSISPILGKYLIWHYRKNTLLNIVEFKECCYWASVEQYHLDLHLKNPHLLPLFQAYDWSYQSDKTS